MATSKKKTVRVNSVLSVLRCQRCNKRLNLTVSGTLVGTCEHLKSEYKVPSVTLTEV